jgi:CHAT domain-containing protein
MHCLQQTPRLSSPDEPSPLRRRVIAAAQRLRSMTGAELRDIVERLALQADVNVDEFPVEDRYNAEHPFEHPKFWAPFVLIGEDA